MISRRGLILGAVGLVSSPAIVRFSSLMPVKAFLPKPFFIKPGEVGEVVIIRGGEATLTDSGNLRLMGDFKLGPGRSLTMIYSGEEWSEIARSIEA